MASTTASPCTGSPPTISTVIPYGPCRSAPTYAPSRISPPRDRTESASDSTYAPGLMWRCPSIRIARSTSGATIGTSARSASPSITDVCRSSPASRMCSISVSSGLASSARRKAAMIGASSVSPFTPPAANSS